MEQGWESMEREQSGQRAKSAAHCLLTPNLTLHSFSNILTYLRSLFYYFKNQ